MSHVMNGYRGMRQSLTLLKIKIRDILIPVDKRNYSLETYDKLMSVRESLRRGHAVHVLEELAIDEELCNDLVQYFDIEDCGKCSALVYVQESLLQIVTDSKIKSLEDRIKELGGQP